TVTGNSPTGTVTFKEGSTVLGTGTIAAGTATLNHTFNTVGAYSLTAEYAGDATNAASTSAAVAQTVNLSPTSTIFTTSVNPAAAGQPNTMSATVTGANPAANPTGTVTFKDGVTPLGTGTLVAGKVTLNYVGITVGTHTLTATYNGDSYNAASTSAVVAQVINKGTSKTLLTVSSNPALTGEAVVLKATVMGALPNGTVTFKNGATIVGTATLSVSQATLNTSFSAAGTYSLTASYEGDANNNASTSAAVNVTVAAEKITYYHNDISGTPMVATNAVGALLWKESYRPYGDPMQPPAADNNIWFTGKPYDKDSGLSYMGARYYDPLIGRFTGIDPVGFREDNIHSFNRYAYANNNPNRYVDPDGKFAKEIVVLAVIVVGVNLAIKAYDSLHTSLDAFKDRVERATQAADGVNSPNNMDANALQEGNSRDFAKIAEATKKGAELVKETIGKGKVDPAKKKIVETFPKNLKDAVKMKGKYDQGSDMHESVSKAEQIDKQHQ
ncbi:MAG: Ig-like domain repeat protein, partial [Sideroxyarcus sp.]